MSVSEFLHKSPKWMKEEGPESDIVISTRIRIARNLARYPFPVLLTEGDADAIIELVRKAIGSAELEKIGKFQLFRSRELSEVERQVFVEKHLISPNLAEDERRSAFALLQDESVSIMVNEEDHLRIQCIFPGLQIHNNWKLASEIDDILESKLDYAFDEKYGYLTSCPTNVGTGLRASVMMHLPGLVLTNQINRILSAISQVGLVVRGLYGEGSDATGNIFQVSNQITLGQSEEEILDNLQGVVKQILQHERAARSLLLRENREQLEDRIWRSFGILSYARKIESKESMQRLSDVKLGIDLGILKNASGGILRELMVMIRPAFLQKLTGKELAPGERDWKRAEIIRKHLMPD
ncbi:protein arginine kinase [Effusibacillus dendaii]|uniref:Protein-arginine kinase n=1 Tax=Effusibacillus dendaii TaxID=2743772 RepID=A0A7I8DEI6_9BACL|nr:protein arginine kinase [Effusibacillus dendaii]BCJ87369.1 protein-arginine kinase [Effusibacillus dendaii]